MRRAVSTCCSNIPCCFNQRSQQQAEHLQDGCVCHAIHDIKIDGYLLGGRDAKRKQRKQDPAWVTGFCSFLQQNHVLGLQVPVANCPWQQPRNLNSTRENLWGKHRAQRGQIKSQKSFFSIQKRPGGPTPSTASCSGGKAPIPKAKRENSSPKISSLLSQGAGRRTVPRSVTCPSVSWHRYKGKAHLLHLLLLYYTPAEPL